jgi:hypothetical protein
LTLRIRPHDTEGRRLFSAAPPYSQMHELSRTVK